MRQATWIILLLIGCHFAAMAQNQTATEGKYSYEYALNDPTKTRIYTLDNGLKVYLAINKDAPRIQTSIAVRTGSKNDPRDNTGLAHYLEHMLFKGTSRIATKDWDKEKALLQQISDLYEQHKATPDPAQKQRIYQQIDSLSLSASQYAIPNEYDKMISSLGAKGTNAYTSTDETVYINDIPSTGVEKWLMVESERFQELVLRLFHTELEAVYEEYNMGQDNVRRKMYQATLEALFPTHPYNVSTIGLGEHLKNPSMEAIHNYFSTYYVPNNIAICMAGDLDYAQTIAMIDKYFSSWKPKTVKKNVVPQEAPMHKALTKEVLTKDPEFLNIVYRFPTTPENELMLKLVDGILQNGQAGLIDLNLLQEQKVLDAATYIMEMSDYTLFNFYGKPRKGQSLEEVAALLNSQLDLLKKGDFEEWLLNAVIKDYKLKELKSIESNAGITAKMVSAFIDEIPWQKQVNKLDAMSKISKTELLKFVNMEFRDNHVVIFKKQGEAPESVKIPKPKITPINLNREAQSDFYKKFEATDELRLQPVFLDFQKDIQQSKVGKIPFYYTHNEINPTFALYYVFDMGTNHDKRIGLATAYLPYLGTDRYTPAQLQQEFYKLGVSFDVYSAGDRMYVSLKGLEESFSAGVALFEHLLANVKADDNALQGVVTDILKSRADAKKDKNAIFGALYNYGQYGAKSEQTNILSEKELTNITAAELVKTIQAWRNYQHYIYYYGTQSSKDVASNLKKLHKTPKKLLPYPAPATYIEQNTNKNRVYFVNYDEMVQAQVYMMSKGKNFDQQLVPYAAVFNEYFGGGLSSIVFQEIRESRALAYSAYAGFDVPAKTNEAHYSTAFVGTQADKLKDALTAMSELLTKMPEAEAQFSGSKLSLLKQIESERITKTQKFFTFLRAKDRGLTTDIRKNTYAKAQNMTWGDLSNFYQTNIGNRNYTIVVMGSRDKLDMNYLQSLGEFKELTLEEVFGY